MIYTNGDYFFTVLGHLKSPKPIKRQQKVVTHKTKSTRETQLQIKKNLTENPKIFFAASQIQLCSPFNPGHAFIITLTS